MDRTKIWATVTVIAVVIIALVAVFYGQAPSEDTIKIGAVLGLTGSHAYYGEEALNGINLALDEINKESSVKLQLLLEDGKGDPASALSAAKYLIESENTKTLITFSGASSALSILPVTNEKQIIQMELICYAPGCHTKNDYLFRVSGQAYDESYYIAEDLVKRGKTKVAVVYVNNDMGAALSNFFKEKFESLDGKVLLMENFIQGTIDFRSILTKIKNIGDVDAIVTFSYGEIGYLLKQRLELGLGNILLYSMETVKDPNTLKIAGGSSLVNLLFSYPGHANSSTYFSFVDKYSEKHDRYPSIYALKGYDAMNLIHLALKECNFIEDTTCIKEKLSYVKDFNGASNIITLTDYGELEREYFHTETFSDGNWQVVV